VVVVVISQNDCNRPTIPTGNVPPDNPCIFYTGRVYANESVVNFDWSGVVIKINFEGTSITLLLSGGTKNEYNVEIDGKQLPILNITSPGLTSYKLGSGLTDTDHTLTFSKRTEASYGIQILHSIILDSGKWIKPSPPGLTRKLEFLGASITCGYGDEGIPPCSNNPATENNFKAYGALIGEHFNAEINVECWSGKGVVRNGGDKNITSQYPFPAYFNRTLATDTTSDTLWPFKWIPQGVVINLGTNDYSGKPTPPDDVFIGGYLDYVKAIRARYGQTTAVFLACGPLIGNPCCSNIQKVVEQAQPNAYYVDLQGILGQGDIGCDGHPNVNGHIKMAKIVIPIVTSALNWQ